MPYYTFNHPNGKATIDVFFHMNDEKEFFDKNGLIECHVQNELSILAACEDPTTIGQFDYSGLVWPLPQTGQMHLEDIILNLLKLIILKDSKQKMKYDIQYF